MKTFDFEKKKINNQYQECHTRLFFCLFLKHVPSGGGKSSCFVILDLLFPVEEAFAPGCFIAKSLLEALRTHEKKTILTQFVRCTRARKEEID
jgi:hypothetical protein